MNLFEYLKGQKDLIVVYDERFGLATVKYVNLSVDWSLPYRLDSRGLVINTEGGIVGLPYSKFFNYKQLELYGEIADEIRNLSEWQDGDFRVMDKADGSLVIAYTYKDKLFLSSSGQVEGQMSGLFFELLDRYPSETRERLTEVCKTYTLNMEFVSPRNRIVIDYPEEKFILHGARVTKTGEYLSYEELKELALYLKIDLIKFYDEIETLDELLAKLETLTDVEGFVVWFNDSNLRLKFKTEEYLRLHRIYAPSIGRFKTKGYVNSIYQMLVDETLDDYISECSKLDNEKAKKLFAKIFNAIEEVSLKVEEDYQSIIEFVKDNHDIIKGDPELFHKKAVLFSKDNILGIGIVHKVKAYVESDKFPTINEFLKASTKTHSGVWTFLKDKIFAIEHHW